MCAETSLTTVSNCVRGLGHSHSIYIRCLHVFPLFLPVCPWLQQALLTYNSLGRFVPHVSLKLKALLFDFSRLKKWKGSSLLGNLLQSHRPIVVVNQSFDASSFRMTNPPVPLSWLFEASTWRGTWASGSYACHSGIHSWYVQYLGLTLAKCMNRVAFKVHPGERQNSSCA